MSESGRPHSANRAAKVEFSPRQIAKPDHSDPGCDSHSNRQQNPSVASRGCGAHKRSAYADNCVVVLVVPGERCSGFEAGNLQGICEF